MRVKPERCSAERERRTLTVKHHHSIAWKNGFPARVEAKIPVAAIRTAKNAVLKPLRVSKNRVAVPHFVPPVIARKTLLRCGPFLLG